MNKENTATFLYRKTVLPSTAPFCEQTHNTTFLLLEHLQNSNSFLKLLRKEFQLNEERLRVNALGIEFSNPFLLAAGMDKDARAVSALATFGLGGIETGSFTLWFRKGNPQIREEILPNGGVIKVKRMERFPDGTVINWMGFPGVGTAKAVENLKVSREKAPIPVGVNIAASPGLMSERAKIEDLRMSLELIYPLKPAWITFNISCPNVEEVDRDRKILEAMLLIGGFAREAEVLEKGLRLKVPRLIKFGPDMWSDEIGTMVKVTKENNYDGIVATNVTVDRTGSREKYAFIKKGGLSGPLLFEKSLATVRLVRQFDREFGGEPLVIIGCGGIDSVEKWIQMKNAGADLCQILTGFVFGGPYFFKKLNRKYLNNLQ